MHNHVIEIFKFRSPYQYGAYSRRDEFNVLRAEFQDYLNRSKVYMPADVSFGAFDSSL